MFGPEKIVSFEWTILERDPFNAFVDDSRYFVDFHRQLDAHCQ